jgi:ketosteroid isomerase-like protein
MPVIQDSPAVAIVRAYAEAWSNHDWDRARESLAADVHFTVTTTEPTTKDIELSGIKNYMRGLIKFAGTVVPGSAQVIASVGDERNALILLTVRAALGPDGASVTLPLARLALLDDENKIKDEQVVFFAVPD